MRQSNSTANLKISCCLLFLAGILMNTPSARADSEANPQEFLLDYARTGRSAFEFEVVNKGELLGRKVYIIKLTSQTWRGHDWRHWLKIFIPGEVRYEDSAILVIAGGDNNPEPPPLYMPEIPFFTLSANQIGAPVAVLKISMRVSSFLSFITV